VYSFGLKINQAKKNMQNSTFKAGEIPYLVNIFLALATA
jgi:hypothetical protein